jgi:PAS domain S-box-containing protein
MKSLSNVPMPSLYIPHEHCYLWQTKLVGLHLASDLTIAISYFSISLALFYFAQKRTDLPFNWIFQLFAAFILLGGTTHLLEIWTLWHPDYWLSGITKAMTAAASAYTAVVLVTLIPQALTLPSLAQLETSNQALQQQIHNRELAEAQIQQLNKELETRVTERTKELAASMLQVRDLAERMTLATDAARIGTYDWNLITQKITWNNYYATLLGYLPETTAADSYQAWERRVAPGELPRVKAALELARDTQTDYSEEYRIVWDDGSSHWIEAFGRFYYDSDGQPVRMTGVITDITERIQSESDIRESEEQFRATFEQAAVGVAHVSLTGQWLRINQKFCGIIGYTEAELLDSTFQDITHPKDLSADLEYVRQLLAGDIQTYTMEKRYIHKLGQIVWVNLTVSMRRDALNAPIHFISVVEKIDDRKWAEFALKEQAIELAKTATLVKQRNQDLDQFAHIVSHDLKAPLRAIANLSTWIEEDLEEGISSETREHLKLMRSRVHRMEGLVNGLLDYARVGSTQASLTTFAIEDLLAEIIDSLSLPASFIIVLPTNLPVITTNYLLLSQVFANLLSNACKHHDRSNGQIRVTAKPQGDIWTFTVADDGPGIAPENQERVFGIFQTLADDHKQENTGIGLSIVKKIVESQGGKIILESEIGIGTTFQFTWIANSG